MRSFIEWIMAKAFLALFAFWNNLSVVGIENIPKDGNFIAASNHEAILTPLLFYPFFIKEGRWPLLQQKVYSVFH